MENIKNKITNKLKAAKHKSPKKRPNKQPKQPNQNTNSNKIIGNNLNIRNAPPIKTPHQANLSPGHLKNQQEYNCYSEYQNTINLNADTPQQLTHYRKYSTNPLNQNGKCRQTQNEITLNENARNYNPVTHYAIPLNYTKNLNLNHHQ